LSIAPDYQDILAACGEKKNTLEVRQQRSVILASKELHDALAVDKQFIEEFEMTKSRAQQVRFEARKTNDFQLFVPHLERIIVLSRQYAQAIAPHTDPYNTLLDIYEE
jgi:carboxypeptidase Taq